MNDDKLLARAEEIARSEKENGSDQWAWGDWTNEVLARKHKGRSDQAIERLRMKLVERGVEVPLTTTLSTYRRVASAWPEETRSTVGFKAAHILAAQADRFELAQESITASAARALVNKRNIEAIAATEYLKRFAHGEITDLAMDQIILDWNILPRITKRELVNQYAACDLSLFPPVAVFQIDGRLYLADGLHRYEAHRLQDKKEIRSEILVGTKSDARRHAVRANNYHGIRFTEEENIANIERERAANPGASEEYICQVLGMARRTMRNYVAAAKVIDAIGNEKVSKLNWTKILRIGQNAPPEQWNLLADAAIERNWSARDVELVARNLNDATVPVMFKERLIAGRLDPLHYDRSGKVVTPVEYLADPEFAQAFIEVNQDLRSSLAAAFSNREGEQREKARQDAKEAAPDLLNESDWLNAIGQLSSARYKLINAVNLFRAIETVDEAMRAQVREELHTIGIASDFLQSWATGTARSLDEELQAILNESE